MPSANEVLAGFHKRYGKSIGGLNAARRDCPRFPTGVFALDVALGGGWPLGRITTVYGGESSGKTTLVLKAIARMQKVQPDKKCVFIDVENTTDEQFATLWGVDWKKLVHLVPEYGEHAVNMAKEFIQADDVALVAVDSVVALTHSGIAEADGDAEEFNVGKGGILGAKLLYGAQFALSRATAAGRKPLVFMINQPRSHIGPSYGGPPDRLPGGQGQHFVSSLIVKLWGKTVIEPKYHASMPVVRETKGRVIKWKVPILSQGVEYRLVLREHKNLKVGECDDWDLVSGFLKSAGQLTKGKTGYSVLKRNFPTQAAIRERLYNDPVFAADMRALMVKQYAGGIIEPGEDAEEMATLGEGDA